MAGFFTWISFHSAHVNTPFAVESASFKQPRTPVELLALSPAELEHCDIARMNLLCAEGLPGADKINVDGDLATLDSWARHVQAEIDRNFRDYWENPAYFDHSTNFYKMAMMARVLYEDYGIRYDPQWIVSPGAERPGRPFLCQFQGCFYSWTDPGQPSGHVQFDAGALRGLGAPARLSAEAGHDQTASVCPLGQSDGEI